MFWGKFGDLFVTGDNLSQALSKYWFMSSFGSAGKVY